MTLLRDERYVRSSEIESSRRLFSQRVDWATCRAQSPRRCQNRWLARQRTLSVREGLTVAMEVEEDVELSYSVRHTNRCVRDMRLP